MPNTICHFEIPAQDPKAASEFYGQLFNWTIAAGGSEYLLVQTSDRPGALGGALFSQEGEGRGVTLYVLVDSIDDTVTRLEQLGGSVVTPKAAVPQMGWTVLARDPQGNPIGLFQVDKEAADPTT